VELDYALLADSAQVADGKTYILGGGVSILHRPEFPAPLSVTLVLQLTYERTETETQHELRVVVMDADGNPILPELRASMGLGPPTEDLPRGVPLVAPIALGFPPLPVLQRPGSYQVQILVDNRHLKTLPFAVVRVERPQGPPA
jgi:Family of unknown function (DUF6941)